MLLLVLRGLLSPSAAAAMEPTLQTAQGAAVAVVMQQVQTPPPAQGRAAANGFTVKPASPCDSAATPSASLGNSGCTGGDAVGNACFVCAQCDICHAALLLPTTPRGPSASADSVVHARPATALASACAALAIQPPIF